MLPCPSHACNQQTQLSLSFHCGGILKLQCSAVGCSVTVVPSTALPPRHLVQRLLNTDGNPRERVRVEVHILSLDISSAGKGTQFWVLSTRRSKPRSKYWDQSRDHHLLVMHIFVMLWATGICCSFSATICSSCNSCLSWLLLGASYTHCRRRETKCVSINGSVWVQKELLLLSSTLLLPRRDFLVLKALFFAIDLLASQRRVR